VAPAAARPSHRQPIRIGTYDGTSAFETFVAKFNNAAVYNGWNNEVACESSETRMIRTNDDAAPLGRVAGLLLMIWKKFLHMLLVTWCIRRCMRRFRAFVYEGGNTRFNGMTRTAEADIGQQQALDTGAVPMMAMLQAHGDERFTGPEPMRQTENQQGCSMSNADDRPFLAIWGGRRPESGLTQPWETFIVTSHISASHRIAGSVPLRPSAVPTTDRYSPYGAGGGRKVDYHAHSRGKRSS